MKGFKQYLAEKAQHTDLADINEILYGYYMVGGNWGVFDGSNAIMKQLEAKKAKATEEQIADEEGRAQAMAKETKKWLDANGYDSNILHVWWTARPGVLKKAVKRDVDSRTNPTDVLVQIGDGAFIGLSAKSTKGKKDIGFKNPGLGTIGKELGMDLSGIEGEHVDTLNIEDLPKSKAARKKWIRANKDIQKVTIQAGLDILEKVIHAIFQRLKQMPEKKLREHVLQNWMDASNAIYPPYIKVTGKGRKGKYTATIMDPLKSDKMAHLNKGPIELKVLGGTSIGIAAGGKRIMKIRAKYESEKIASSIKFSGEPW